MKTFTVNAFGEKTQVFCTRGKYVNGTLGIEVFEMNPDYDYPEPFGALTVNLDHPAQSATRAFVKTYSENEGWAEELLKLIGAEPTGITVQSGFATLPLYDFSKSSMEKYENPD